MNILLLMNRTPSIITDDIHKWFADTILLIGNEEIPVNRTLLCLFNEELKNIILNSQDSMRISLPEIITKKAFLLMIRYYGFSTIKIDEDNVSELLLCAICLKEEKIITCCKHFILSHLSDKLIEELLNILQLIPESLSEIKTAVTDYIRMNRS